MGTLSVDKLMKTSTGAAEFTLPATDGAAGTVLQTDGSGQLSVATVGSAGIATDAVTATQIAANAVTTTEIVDDAVTIAKLAATGTASATTFLRGDNSWATGPSGITQVSSWDMTTDFSSDLDPINANWAVFTSAYGYGSIGSAMTEASGLFTFPVTGIWQIFFCADFKISAAENRYVNATINTTTDNSTYTRATQQRGSMYADSSNFVYETVRTDFIFNVTDTTLCKCSLGVHVEDNSTVTEGGGTGGNPHRTYATFMRLGDT